MPEIAAPPPPKRDRSSTWGRKGLAVLWRLGLSVLIVGVLLHFVDWDRMVAAALDLEPWRLTAAAAGLIALSLAGAVRWWGLLRLRGYGATLLWVMRVRLIAQGLSVALPGGVAGDILSVFYVTEYPKRTASHTLGTVFADRVLGLAAIVATCAAAVATDPLVAAVLGDVAFSFGGYLPYAAGGAFAAILVMILLGRRFARRFYLAAANAVRMLAGYRHHVWAMLALLGYSIILHLAVCVLVWWVGRDLGPVDLWSVVMAVSLTMLLSILPVSYNGLGIREATFLLFLVHSGFPSEAAIVLSLVWLALTVTSLGAVGALAAAFTPAPDTSRKLRH
ncbi:lysylphosphatidylglycerol synthase transmembrane domain-containing protein [Rhodospira trueperi]|uniref:Uncharacterized membrane protein YbhN, UPF0104 family n=1 Tax=Rhodospira trueperi TaxID=69960 RepID=A0A1G7GND1_9PROT|nr:lysylphosphatidylglycerol synthase transmembrane domain-containing protein [Rhodospira trueperi]SDE89678.1 Uncharacterized membrane protein YbhN, UPF0104 family [Rhodospira trueperi]